MNFDIIVTTPFERKFKRLLKKHKSLSSDLQILVEQLSKNPLLWKPDRKKLLQNTYRNFFQRKGKIRWGKNYNLRSGFEKHGLFNGHLR